MQEVHQAFANQKLSMVDTRGITKTVLISWNPPTHNWIKLNTDGCSKGNPGIAGGGGVIRDSLGRWLGGFLVHIGTCDALWQSVGLFMKVCVIVGTKAINRWFWKLIPN